MEPPSKGRSPSGPRRPSPRTAPESGEGTSADAARSAARPGPPRSPVTRPQHQRHLLLRRHRHRRCRHHHQRQPWHLPERQGPPHPRPHSIHRRRRHQNLSASTAWTHRGRRRSGDRRPRPSSASSRHWPGRKTAFQTLRLLDEVDATHSRCFSLVGCTCLQARKLQVGKGAEPSSAGSHSLLPLCGRRGFQPCRRSRAERAPLVPTRTASPFPVLIFLVLKVARVVSFSCRWTLLYTGRERRGRPG